MRVAVIGAGGIGGIYGAALAQAGVDVTFVARGAHLAAMRENGLRIEGDRGETHIQPVHSPPISPASGLLITCCCASNCGMSRAPANRSAQSSGRELRSSHCRMEWTPPIGSFRFWGAKR